MNAARHDPAASLEATSAYLRGLGIREATVVIDEKRVRANIARMAAKARQSGVTFRPHFKTHQSATIGDWFRSEGVTAITVSSLAMGEYFAAHGWDDLTVAMLVNPLEIPRIDRLARSLAGDTARTVTPQLGVLVDSSPVVAALAAGAETRLKVWLKIDTGYGRTGRHWQDAKGLAELAAAVTAAPRLELAGLLTHAGHSYHLVGKPALSELYATTVERLLSAREDLRAAGPAVGTDSLAISVGDTPTCSSVTDFGEVDEVRPGNFVFYDLMQLDLGACRVDDLAAAVVCPVIGCYPERGQLAVHAGAVQLGKESLGRGGGPPSYGCLGSIGTEGFGAPLSAAGLISLSQEHGLVSVEPTRYSELFGELAPGDLVLVHPVHACLSCDLHGHYLSLSGERITRRQSR